MAHSDNNALSSAFKTFFERETLTGPNFNEWHRSLRIVLRVADTYDYLYKPCPDQPPETATAEEKAAWKAEYKKHSDVACIMLGKMSPALQRQFENYPPQNMLAELRKMFEKPPAVEIYDLVDSLHSCKQAPVNLINRSLNKDFGDFVRNFNMHCVGKTVSDLHALLIDYEKGLKDKVTPTPQVFSIQKGRDNKSKPQGNKQKKGKGKADKNKQVVPSQPKPNPKKRKENPNKDQALSPLPHVWALERGNCPLYLEELRAEKLRKKSEHSACKVLDAVILVCNTLLLQGFNAERKLAYGVSISAYGNGSTSSYLPILAKNSLQKLHTLKVFWNVTMRNLSIMRIVFPGELTRNLLIAIFERATDLLGLFHTDVCGPLRHWQEKISFWEYALEILLSVRILNMVPTKKVDKTPYEIWHGKVPNLSYLKVWGCEAYVKRDSADKLQQRSVWRFLKSDLISQEFSGRDYDLEDDHMDILPSKNTSEIPVEPESLGPPPKLIHVRRSERTTRAPNPLCLNMEVEDDVVGDLGEPANYKAAMLDPDKVIWQGAMDEEMNSIKVNEVWTEVDPPPNAKIVRSKWLFKKKTDMDGKVHTYKARLVAKGSTQTYRIDYEETFSPATDIRAIRILIAIAAYYNYEI
ncbi:retrotransposon protein, putative, ty1-copia subclass [Tanacetum coccineum]|uniref:Retrotransposon protein, putative, ty1-copia subclass n=1 Tax=Tanacetum coccineum TaxID=301880 RepID=A0ABQ5D4P6_9ASTR